MRQNLRTIAAAVATLAIASTPASSEEGMWTFDHFPSARMQEQMGWAPDRAWLDRVLAGAARMPGCSASNVSDEGLALTNHHCVIACVTALSTAQADYIADGFMARAREEERRCPGMTIQVLESVADVTGEIDQAAAGTPPEAFAHVRDAEIARLTRACNTPPSMCEVVMLYQGGRYALHRYHRYDDVRLVFAPEHAMAAFGGDADNFTFPRYGLDFSFVRLYEDGAPAHTPRHLSMRFTPLAEGDIVLIAGNPGRTSRLRTASELAFERDVNLPWQIASLQALGERLAVYAAIGPDRERASSAMLQNVQNAIKGLSGRRDALMNEEGFAHVIARESDLQTRVGRNLAAAREMGDAWGEVARAQDAYRAIFLRYQHLELRAGERSQLFAWARDIVRAAAERTRPEGARLARYAETRLPMLAQSIRAERAVDPGLEALSLAFWLQRMAADLPEGDPGVARILAGQSPEELAERLALSHLTDRAYREALWDGGAEAVAASDDPMIAFVRAWDEDARAVRARYVTEVEAPVARAQERIARARFRAFGLERYPETTFSPRLSYGRVSGWTEPDNTVVGPFTRVAGLFERASGVAPFALSARWLEARSRLDGSVVFNVATSNDVIGGSSGSPLLDRDGNVVGVAFDGNIHSLGGEYFYDGALNRSISVASTAIALALRDVYGMNALADELGVP